MILYTLKSSVMKTLLTNNLILSVVVPYLLKDSEGWACGTNNNALKVTSPSATKWVLARGSWVSLLKLL